MSSGGVTGSEENDNLKKKLKDCEEEKAKNPSKEANDKLQKEIDNLKKKLKDCEEEKAKNLSKDDNDKLKKEIDDLKKKLKDYCEEEKTKNPLKEAYNKLKKENDTLREELKKLEEKIKELKNSQYQNLLKENQELEKENKTAQQQNDRLNVEYQKTIEWIRENRKPYSNKEFHYEEISDKLNLVLFNFHTNGVYKLDFIAGFICLFNNATKKLEALTKILNDKSDTILDILEVNYQHDDPLIEKIEKILELAKLIMES
ncbi:12269_t:CDS:2, partial [Cetraspora pellucida]